MFQAQLIMSSNPSQPIYSPWFPRQADNLRVNLEVVATGASALLKVTVHTKNMEDTTDGSSALSEVAGDIDGAGSGVGVGRQWAEFGPSSSPSGLKELVRYKFDPGTTTNGWILFRMLAPVWFDTMK